MRSHNVILLIALVLFSFSNSFEFTNLAEVKELRSSTYGNSLIETISLTLANAGSIDEVKKLLTDLLYKLNSDQRAADVAWAKLNKQLTDKINRLTTEIAELETQISLDEADKKKNEGLRDQSIVNLKQYKAQLRHNMESLTFNEENRKKDIEEYRKSVQEHGDVINAIEAVIRELKKLTGSISGKGRPTHVNENAAEKRDREYALKKSFVELTKDEEEAQMFIEMATTADQRQLKKLISLLESLSLSTKKSLNDDEVHERKSLKTYNQLKDALTADNKKLDVAIAEQKRNLAHYKSEVARLSKKIADEKILLESKKIEKKTTIKQRQDAENQYKHDKAERDSERKIIQKLQKVVEERLANMSKFLRSETGAF
jgi:chromosome segregation ATPase